MTSKFVKCGELNMPIVGFGTWQATGDELEKGLEAALEAGYRHIDTATIYQNEAVIGKVLKRWFDAGKLKRSDVFVTTKLPLYAIRADMVEDTLRSSLSELGLDYVDLYLIHFPVYCTITATNEIVASSEPTDHLAIWKVMEERCRAGKAKTIGLSNFNQSQIENILHHCTIKPASLQIELHLYLQQNELVQYCKANGISVVAYSTLGNPGANTNSFGVTFDLPNVLNNALVLNLAKKYNKTPAQIVLRQVIQRGVVVIPKSTNPKRCQENISIFDFSISDEDMVLLAAEHKGDDARIFKAFIKGIDNHPQKPY